MDDLHHIISDLEDRGRIHKSKDQRRLDVLKDLLVKVSLNFSLIFSRSNLSHNMPVVLKI